MKSEMNDLMVLYPDKLWLDLSDQEQQTAWQISAQNHYSNPAARWNAYLNCLCLNAFLDWLKEEPDLGETPKVWPSDYQLPSIWEFVNGTCLTVGELRLVLIPSDKSNLTEFRIPQEWVDIPNWVANYYLAVQINLEENWIGIWGYTTYQQIREKAKYDLMDRTYLLDEEDLIADINVMWVAREVCSVQKPELKMLPELSSVQIEKLLKQLDHWTPDLPENVSEQEWMALLALDQGRQDLYQKRLAKHKGNLVAYSQPLVNNLSKWFQNVFEAGWHSFDTLVSSQQNTLAVQFRSDATLNEVRVKGAKLIDLGMQLRNTAVVLLIGLTSEIDEKVSIRVQLHPANEEVYLPPDLKLLLLSGSGNILQEVKSRSHDNFIQLKKFKSPPGKNFSLQVTLGDISIKEDFMLEKLVG
ncbi:DUF1822 family protein [Fischerella thermalis]|uniref:DUF1822 family protein n=1 Tax=Fischerella thermalis JSC-11 TaxID=741277 RepID=G6FTD3_9CYAN|nr:DUF1822 family protein [Fischerella thermalis]EHC13866.1 protein of unknown function DUF1822 [Fischerella thermalis JSC-11]PLZ25430.1 hypothetical protein CBP28_15915 [Fischerella thermalis WC559]PLZ32802.1 hypothetical protein CBP27_18645 [Fischerella thermalis WC542]PLZ63067.1 hypothetical protein CBP22_20490 [Fischerella thermalis WC249]PLZ74023.1 hypothetical protein CBP21_03045 [Fischerella thermalis WC246]